MSGCILKQSVSIKNCQEKKNSKTYTIKPNYLYHIKKKRSALMKTDYQIDADPKRKTTDEG